MPSSDTYFTSENQPAPEKKTHGIHLKTLIKKVWSEEITGDDGNKTIRAIKSLKALVEKAEKGDVAAFKALAERLEGMPKQEIDQTNTHSFTKMPTIKTDDNNLELDID